jgi:hypothetical protein
MQVKQIICPRPTPAAAFDDTLPLADGVDHESLPMRQQNVRMKAVPDVTNLPIGPISDVG